MLKAALNRLAARAALLVVVTLLGLAGAGFLLASLYLRLAEVTNPPLAAFLAGVIALTAAAIVAGIFWLGGRADRKRTTSPAQGEQRATSSEAATLAGAMGAEMGSWVAKNSRTAVFGALLTGIVLGASPKARSEARRLIETIASGWKPPR